MRYVLFVLMFLAFSVHADVPKPEDTKDAVLTPEDTKDKDSVPTPEDTKDADTYYWKT